MKDSTKSTVFQFGSSLSGPCTFFCATWKSFFRQKYNNRTESPRNMSWVCYWSLIAFMPAGLIEKPIVR